MGAPNTGLAMVGAEPSTVKCTRESGSGGASVTVGAVMYRPGGGVPVGGPGATVSLVIVRPTPLLTPAVTGPSGSAARSAGGDDRRPGARGDIGRPREASERHVE